jgi:hypothetical protein
LGRFASVWLAVGLVLLPGQVRAQGFRDNPLYGTARGPLEIRNPRTYNLLFLQFMPQTPDVLKEGASVHGLKLDVINNMLMPRPSNRVTVIEDHEVQRLAYTWRRGLGRGMEVSIRAPLLYRNGGVLDEMINAWHAFFHTKTSIDNRRLRENVRPYASVIALADASGAQFTSQGNALGLGDVSATLKRELLRPSHRAGLAARIGLKLPTGNAGRILGSGAADLGLAMDGRYSLGRDFIAYGGLGGVAMGRAAVVPGAERAMMQWYGAVEYRANGRDSYLWQIDANTRPVRTGHAFADRTHVSASFGIRRVLDRRLVLEASFTENGDFHDYRLPALSSVGPDFTASLGVTWHP